MIILSIIIDRIYMNSSFSDTLNFNPGLQLNYELNPLFDHEPPPLVSEGCLENQ